MTKESRSASIIAEGKCECAALSREDFTKLLGPYSDFKELKKGSVLPRTESSFVKDVSQVKHMEIDDVDIMSVLGVGGFGLVSLARDKKTNETYALKKMQKQRIVDAEMQEMIVNEKNFLAEMQNPFVLRLIATSQDAGSVYLILEFLQGGDLFSLLEKIDVMDMSESRFYMGCTILALEYVHSRCIAFRDLKLENLVMDSQGYIKLVDFGLAKRVMNRTYTVCGSPRYCAPEIVTGRGHCHFVDWWALGITMFECIYASSPFATGDNLETFRKIANGSLTFPRRGTVSSDAKDLMAGLLKKKAAKRLGCGAKGASEVKQHAFYKTFAWSGLESMTMKAPHPPKIASDVDVDAFGEVDIYEEHLEELDYDPDTDVFEGWTNEF